MTTILENGHTPFCPKSDGLPGRWGSVGSVDPTPSTAPVEAVPTVKQLSRWSEALAGIARTGLGFTESLYEQERFEEVLHVAADIQCGHRRQRRTPRMSTGSSTTGWPRSARASPAM